MSDLTLQLTPPHCPARCSNCRANCENLDPGANISESFFLFYTLITKLITLQGEGLLFPLLLLLRAPEPSFWDDASSLWIYGNWSKSGFPWASKDHVTGVLRLSCLVPTTSILGEFKLFRFLGAYLQTESFRSLFLSFIFNCDEMHISSHVPS